MGTPSFKPIELRMRRGQEHAENLQAEVEAFLDGEPYSLTHEFDAERVLDVPEDGPFKGVHLYRAEGPPVPDRIAILAGDVLKDVRSALDYVAWQLALAQSDSPPPSTAFPIFAKQKLYERDRLRFLGGIDESIHPEFDAVQPYHAGDKATEEPLWVLHRMANDDKHKVPHIVGALPAGIGFNRPDASVDVYATTVVGPFEGGDVVAQAVITKGEPEQEPEVGLSFNVAFSKDSSATGLFIGSDINRIGVEVNKVLDRFAPFL